MQIVFIGGGNMASALIAGLQRKPASGLKIRVADPSESVRKDLQARFGVTVAASTDGLLDGADAVVIAVKPQVLPAVLQELRGRIDAGQLVLSVAAGATLGSLQQALGQKQAVVRAMPNTPALIGKGIAGLCAGPYCKPHHRDQASRIMRSGGEIVWIDDEALMDTVTAVSGSGPAYFFLLTEALEASGIALGLPPDTARLLAVQTCAGAGAMLAQSKEDPSELRRRVTSPGGTTEAAITHLLENGFRELVEQAVRAAEQRGAELARISN